MRRALVRLWCQRLRLADSAPSASGQYCTMWDLARHIGKERTRRAAGLLVLKLGKHRPWHAANPPDGLRWGLFTSLMENSAQLGRH